MKAAQPAEKPKWPLWLGLFVALGCVATVGYAFYESLWG
ncbi:MAG: hypothetical protein QOH81_1704 [Sphingomonadales bacterium]|jgi:hypothetical protein|nr:hypothetical protein [Sphingomonadales bacterium]